MNKNSTQLNKLLKSECDLVNNMPDDLKLLLTLHEQNMVFTQTHIKNLIRKLLQYELKTKFLNLPKNDEQKNCIKIIFTEIIKDQKDIHTIISHYYFVNNVIRNDCNFLANILFERDDLLSKEVLNAIINIYYVMENVPTTLTQNTILQIIAHLQNSKTDDIYCSHIIKLIQNTNNLPQTYITILFEYINIYGYNSSKGINTRQTYICLLFTELLKKTDKFDKNIFLDTFIKSNINGDEINKCVIHNVGYNNEYINHVFSKCGMLLLFDLIIVGYVPTSNSINMLLKRHHDKSILIEDIDDKYNCINDDIMKWLQRIVIIPETHVPIAAARRRPFGKTITNKKPESSRVDIFELFELFKLKPNIDTVDILIDAKYFLTLNDILSRKYVPIDKILLDKIIRTHHIPLIKKILEYKIVPDDETFKLFVNSNKESIYTDGRDLYYRDSIDTIEIIELFIRYGLQIKLYHIIELLSIHKHLENLERFDILYDENLYFLCYVYEYFPQEYMEKFTIDKNVLQIRKINGKKIKNPIDIMEFIKTNNLKIDRYIVSVIFYNDNDLSSEFIINHNIFPDLLTIYRSTTQYANLDYKDRLEICNKIVEKNNITKDFMLECFDIIQ